MNLNKKISYISVHKSVYTCTHLYTLLYTLLYNIFIFKCKYIQKCIEIKLNKFMNSDEVPQI